VNGGELLVLIGPSGSGKTTALRMMNRMVKPDQGSITIDNTSICSYDPVKLRRNIGYVIQEIGLLPHLTIQQNIGIIPSVSGWSQVKIDNRVNELLELVSLDPEVYRDRYPRELSGGQKQRVGLARALAMDPSLMLMDEPFGALDPILRKQLQDEFLDLKQQLDKTILFVTHDMEEAFKVGDRLAIMQNGELIQVGTPDEIIANPANDFVASLAGSDKKFRYLDYLQVEDMMQSLAPSQIIQDPRSGDQINRFLEETEHQSIVVYQDDTYYLLPKDQENRIEENINQYEVSTFGTKTKLSNALRWMRDHDQYIVLILDKKQPIGILYAEKLLMQLMGSS